MIKSYIEFIKKNFIHVYFGWLLTFFSSFGQTFFISLFVPSILIGFDLTKSEFGGYYAVATMISSFFLLQFGNLVDYTPIRSFTLKTNLLLLLACILLAVAIHPAMVFVALIGLRLGGQGLMSHISLSVMSKHFSDNRGKALSISSMGYPMGEMLFPVLVGISLSFFNWRIAISGAAVFLVFTQIIFSRLNLTVYDTGIKSAANLKPKKWKYIGKIISKRTFWILIMPVFFFSFVVTSLFFYQYVLANEKGWSIEWYALCFTGYAIMRFLFMLYGGILTDKFSAKNLFPYHLIPIILGLLFLGSISSKWAPLLFLILTGVTAGLGNIITSAIIAEIYGTAKVGQVRSIFSMIMVLSTALAPITFGILLDNGVTFSQYAFGCALTLGIVTVNSFRLKVKE